MSLDDKQTVIGGRTENGTHMKEKARRRPVVPSSIYIRSLRTITSMLSAYVVCAVARYLGWETFSSRGDDFNNRTYGVHLNILP